MRYELHGEGIDSLCETITILRLSNMEFSGHLYKDESWILKIL